jgi:hypothetical protein
MPRPAEPERRRRSGSAAEKPPRWSIGREWILRLALLAIVVLGVLLVGRASTMLYSGRAQRLERIEGQGRAVPPPAQDAAEPRAAPRP